MQAIQLLYVPSICDEFQQDRPKEQRLLPADPVARACVVITKHDELSCLQHLQELEDWHKEQQPLPGGFSGALIRYDTFVHIAGQ